jgi:3-hydroxyacyl-CoA dehydrogenase
MFNSIGVIGGGVMAKGVHRALSREGVQVVLIDAREFLSISSVDVSNFDLIIECVVEDFQVKKNIFERLLEVNLDAILASCTSSLSINALQDCLSGSNRFMGIHFMNPASSIKVVEVVPSFETDQSLVGEVISWLESIGRKVLVVPDTPGFVVNALLFSFLNQAMALQEVTGLSPEAIDELVTRALGHPLGPFKTLDLIGLDTSENILENLHLRKPDQFQAPAPSISELTSEGRFGRKSKSGFYNY